MWIEEALRTGNFRETARLEFQELDRGRRGLPPVAHKARVPPSGDQLLAPHS